MRTLAGDKQNNRSLYLAPAGRFTPRSFLQPSKEVTEPIAQDWAVCQQVHVQTIRT